MILSNTRNNSKKAFVAVLSSKPLSESLTDRAALAPKELAVEGRCRGGCGYTDHATPLISASAVNKKTRTLDSNAVSPVITSKILDNPSMNESDVLDHEVNKPTFVVRPRSVSFTSERPRMLEPLQGRSHNH